MHIFQHTVIHTHTNTHTYIEIQRNSLSVDDNIYAPSRGLSTLAKEVTAATRIMQSSSNELSTLVSGKAKM